jgi:Family of unknown function (DUF6440)
MSKWYVLISVLFLLLLSIGCSKREEPQTTPVTRNRFQGLERHEFLGNKAQVVVDSETGIKYLYIWEGGSNGGPAITRLWEK